MASLTNFVLSNTTVTAATNTREIEADYGDVVCCDVLVESVNGAPTSASLVAKFQISPIEYRGYNIDWEPNGDPVQWQDVVAADGFTGHLLVDGAWPASLADQTIGTTMRLVTRRLTVPALGRLIRLVLTPAFTGGASPNFKVSVAFSVPNR